jgi:hypothetical protein
MARFASGLHQYRDWPEIEPPCSPGILPRLTGRRHGDTVKGRKRANTRQYKELRFEAAVGAVHRCRRPDLTLDRMAWLGQGCVAGLLRRGRQETMPC